MTLLRTVLAALTTVLLSAAATATYSENKPCSGKKRGISHCEGRTFICRDGSASRSKKDCQAFTGRAGVAEDGKQQQPREAKRNAG